MDLDESYGSYDTSEFNNTYTSTIQQPTSTVEYSQPSFVQNRYAPIPKQTFTKKKPLTKDQIAAIVIVSIVLVGILFMILGFVGVFNATSPSVSLTPTLAPPTNLPVTVTFA
jgi:hypothetical protein